MSDTYETFLAHYGVKGMHWGHRGVEGPNSAKQSKRSRKGSTQETGPVHEDAAKAIVAKAKIKKSGLHSLSNDEIKDYLARVNLEQQFSRLNPESVNAGKKVASSLVKNAGGITANVAKNLATQQLTKYGTKAFESALKNAGK